MIVYEIAIHKMTVESERLQVPLQPSTIKQSPHRKEAGKCPELQNVKLFIKHDNGHKLLKKS